MKRQKSAIFARKRLNINTLMMKITIKVKTLVILLVNMEVLHIAYVIQNTVYLKKFMWFSQWIGLWLFFILKQLAKEFEGEFDCLGENAEKYKRH